MNIFNKLNNNTEKQEKSGKPGKPGKRGHEGYQGKRGCQGSTGPAGPSASSLIDIAIYQSGATVGPNQYNNLDFSTDNIITAGNTSGITLHGTTFQFLNNGNYEAILTFNYLYFGENTLPFTESVNFFGEDVSFTIIFADQPQLISLTTFFMVSNISNNLTINFSDNINSGLSVGPATLTLIKLNYN
jgi:hypothetical protein